MTLTASEQYLVELINRARLDPQQEAERQGIALNKGLPQATNGTVWPRITTEAKDPLAVVDVLNRSARIQSEHLGKTDYFSHIWKDGTDLDDRLAMAKFNFSGSIQGENLAGYWRGLKGEALMDKLHDSLFASATHRSNMIGMDFREIGISQLGNSKWDYLTENFARHASTAYVTGVAYADKNKDGFYSIGEGQDGLLMRIVGGAADRTEAAGGYALAHAVGRAVTVDIGPSGNMARVQTSLADGNVKLDVINGSLLRVSGDVTLVSGIADAEALGIGRINLTGSDADNSLTGNNAANRLDGMEGRDLLYGAGGNDKLSGGAGGDRLFGGAGNDVLDGDGLNDMLDGGAGNDLLRGGGQNDKLTGGAGADGFEFSQRFGGDTITDFNLRENDTLRFDDALWDGRMSARQLVNTYASVTKQGVEFDFGKDGILLLEDVRSLGGLADAIEIF